ncbi:MAG: DUF1800 domain-containing protein [Blastochloris sp.]|nr:DUF1800 domain-containing protein [Blastochloris sp.]
MLEPLAASDWDRNKAAHLLKRAGFGSTPSELDAWSKLSLQEAVNKLVDWESTPDPTPDPEWAQPGFGLPISDRAELAKLSQEQRKELFQEYQRLQRSQIQELREDWLTRMAKTPRPLQEKMTLYWHGHFATSAEKVKASYYMWKQLDLFRRLGHGSYQTLLVEVGRDPAMLIWLDGAQSKRSSPNENYARELMELFTLGEGHYTEQDIKESARAFTGWDVQRFEQKARYVPQRYDGGQKTFLGETGAFRDEDIVRIILKQDQASRYLATKLWTFFAYENPEPELIQDLAGTLRGEKWELKPVLKKIFLSRAFYSPRCLMAQIKSPVRLVDRHSKKSRNHPLPPPPQHHHPRSAWSEPPPTTQRQRLGRRTHLDQHHHSHAAP